MGYPFIFHGAFEDPVERYHIDMDTLAWDKISFGVWYLRLDSRYPMQTLSIWLGIK